MKIVIINGSHRAKGNTYRFTRIAKEVFDNRHKSTIFDLTENLIKPCKGCLVCENGEDCSIMDDYSQKIRPELKAADLIVFATPVYFNMPSAAMINLINRTNDLCTFFNENSKKTLTFMVGQTDEETIKDAYKCLQSYYEIMGMEEIISPIITIGRMEDDVVFKKQIITMLQQI